MVKMFALRSFKAVPLLVMLALLASSHGVCAGNTENPAPEGMVFVKGGCFEMGDPYPQKTRLDGDADEKPLQESAAGGIPGVHLLEGLRTITGKAPKTTLAATRPTARALEKAAHGRTTPGIANRSRSFQNRAARFELGYRLAMDP